MSHFLTGEQLSGAIRRLLAGRDVRCAVAFWGKGARNALFGGGEAMRGDPRIICDLSMGCTSPSELEKLGAPGNPRLRHIHGLHAKVYISDGGVIVGSANASSNGIGWTAGKAAGLLEAGTFHEAGSPVWQEAGIWFESQHGEARMVDEAALSCARTLWNHGTDRGFAPPGPVSFLTMVRAEPGRFANTGFVFSANKSSPENIETARAAAVLEFGPESKAQFYNWSPDEMCCEWRREDINEWPRRFVLFWKPNPESRLGMWAKDVRHVVYREERGDVFSVPLDWRVFSKRIGRERLFPKAESEVADAALAERVMEMFGPEEGKLFPTAEILAEALEEALEEMKRMPA